MKASRFLTLTPLLAVFVLSSCSTPRVGPYTQKEIQENVYFHYFRKLEDNKLRKKILASSYTLMRSTYPEFLLDVKRIEASSRLLEDLPPALIHGDFHPLQMAWRNGDAVLDDWDTVHEGLPWMDVVRMEASAKLLAGEEGLRAYPDSVCLEAYADYFTTGKPSGKARALRPVDKQEELFEDFSQHPVWKNAASATEIPKDLLEAFHSWISSNPELPVTATDPMKHLVSGVGSLLKQKVLVLDTQKKLWELKEVDASPGECSNYTKLQDVFTQVGVAQGQNPIQSCWSWQGRVFTLLRWDLRYWSPDAKDFKNTAQLVDHVRWSCEKLAEFHKASLDPVATRNWTLALKSPAPLKTRLRALSQEVFKTYQSGYRMIMLEQE